jgi:hypothetical protein
MQKVIIMKKYTQEERDAIIEEIETLPIKPEEWDGPHETRVVSFKYVDDIPHKRKKGLLSAIFDKIKAVLHPA